MSIKGTPDQIVSASAFDFQRDLSRYWRHVRKTDGLALTQQGWAYKSGFKSLLGALNVADSPAEEIHNGKLWFIRRLLTAMHELNVSTADHTVVTSATSKLFNLPMAHRVRWTFEVWRDSGAWNELMRLPIQWSGADMRRDAPSALGKARMTLLRTVGRLPTDPKAWVSVPSLIAHLKKNDYPFLFERRHRSTNGGLYTSPYYSPNNPYDLTFNAVKDETQGWDVVEHSFIINVLTGPLHWLGLVELGYDAAQPERGENQPPAAYRLTDAGGWLLGKSEQPDFVESGGRLIVQPNFTILALEPISDVVLAELDQFAESKGGERAITYELTKETLYRGQRLGWDTARAIRFLETHSGMAVPANMHRTLEEWEATHRRITFQRNKCVVQFADDDAQTEAGAALAALNPHTLGPHFVLIDRPDTNQAGQASLAQPAAQVVTALVDVGWVPVVQATTDTGGEALIRVNDDGDVVFTQAAPNVHALGMLAQFTESPPAASVGGRAGEASEHSGRTGRNGRITSASVRAAMSRGIRVDQLLAVLAELHHGPISPVLESKIRTWANFFGTASVRTVTLVELSHFDVLANLASDPQVGKFLLPIEGASSPLAVVDSAYTEQVRDLLSERGISVSFPAGN